MITSFINTMLWYNNIIVFSCVELITPQFHDEYVPTKIGQFIKDTVTSSGEFCRIEILDTAGEEELHSRLQHYYVTSEGLVFVYAINDKDSLYRVKEMFEDVVIAKGDMGEFDIILVGNKSDMDTERQVLSVEGNDLAAKWGCEYIETSAKSNEFVSYAFQTILAKVHDRKFKVPGLTKRKKKGKSRLNLKCCVV